MLFACGTRSLSFPVSQALSFHCLVSGGISYDVNQILKGDYSSDDDRELAQGLADGAPASKVAQQNHWWWD